MARLPQPGGDAGNWGSVLNDFLKVEHANDGTLKQNGSLAAKADKTDLDAKANTTDLAPIATTGSYTDLTDTPTLGTAAATSTTDYATAAQGTKADEAVPSAQLNTLITEHTDVAANTTARHTHTNQELIDTYDQTSEDITDAVTKRHEHENKEVLDAITEPKLMPAGGSAGQVLVKSGSEDYETGWVNMPVDVAAYDLLRRRDNWQTGAAGIGYQTVRSHGIGSLGTTTPQALVANWVYAIAIRPDRGAIHTVVVPVTEAGGAGARLRVGLARNNSSPSVGVNLQEVTILGIIDADTTGNIALTGLDSQVDGGWYQLLLWPSHNISVAAIQARFFGYAENNGTAYSVLRRSADFETGDATGLYAPVGIESPDLRWR